MCSPKVSNLPPPVAAPLRADAADLAEQARKRLSVRQGYASTIKTGSDGVSNFGAAGVVPSLSAGTNKSLGVGG
jgi:hypothetical protein